MNIKYISQGNPQYIYLVKYGYAFALTSDNVAILCSRTDMEDGVYDENGKADDEITKLYLNKMGRTVDGLQISIQTYVETVLQRCDSFGINAFKAIYGAPKFTKALADGLDKLLEVATFIEQDTIFNFACVCAREVAMAYMPNGVYISPSKYYTISQLKIPLFGRNTPNALIVVDEPMDHICIIGKINMTKRLEVINGPSDN